MNDLPISFPLLLADMFVFYFSLTVLVASLCVLPKLKAARDRCDGCMGLYKECKFIIRAMTVLMAVSVGVFIGIVAFTA